MYKYFCSKGCHRQSGSDGDESVHYDEKGKKIINYNCNICGEVTAYKM